MGLAIKLNFTELFWRQPLFFFATGHKLWNVINKCNPFSHEGKQEVSNCWFQSQRKYPLLANEPHKVNYK